MRNSVRAFLDSEPDLFPVFLLQLRLGCLSLATLLLPLDPQLVLVMLPLLLSIVSENLYHNIDRLRFLYKTLIMGSSKT